MPIVQSALCTIWIPLIYWTSTVLIACNLCWCSAIIIYGWFASAINNNIKFGHETRDMEFLSDLELYIQIRITSHNNVFSVLQAFNEFNTNDYELRTNNALCNIGVHYALYNIAYWSSLMPQTFAQILRLSMVSHVDLFSSPNPNMYSSRAKICYFGQLYDKKQSFF